MHAIGQLHTTREAAGIFNGKVSQAELAAYNGLVEGSAEQGRKGIIPDILVSNYPAETQEGLDRLDGTTSLSKELIVENKGLRNTPQNYPKNKRATDSKAEKVIKEYSDKCRSLDSEIYPQPVGSTQEGPFTKALKQFAHGGIIPIVVGAFGETNNGFDKLVKKMAKLAAKTERGKRAAPARYGSSRGPEVLHLTLMRRYLGVQFVKINAQHKLRRMHLVGASQEEAMALAHNGGRAARIWNRFTDCPSYLRANYFRQGAYQAWLEFVDQNVPIHPTSRDRVRRMV